MRRRDFIVGTTSVAGLLLLDNATAQTPCPPLLTGAAANNCPAPAGGNVLESAASSLTPGQWLYDPIAKNRNSTRWDISWQNVTAFWDDTHRELQYMGKRQASMNGTASHHIYDEETNTWLTSSLNLQNEVWGTSAFGHVWNNCFDHTDDSGDYYFVPQDFRDSFWRFNRSAWSGDGDETSWEEAPPSGFTQLGGTNASIVWGGIASDPGMAYHPNLFGQGRPGVICWGVQRLSCWDKNNNSWTEITTGSWSEYRNNVSLYVPGHDSVVYGTGKEGGRQVTIFPANFGSAGTGLGTQRTPPIEISGGNTNNSAHMILDPRDQSGSTIMLLERGGNRVWTSNNLFQDWSLEPFTHPFFGNLGIDGYPGRWTCCNITRYGVVVGMSSYGANNGSQFESIMWRPG